MTTQAEMNLIGLTQSMESAEADLVKLCKSQKDAVYLTVTLSNKTHTLIAEEMGMNKGNFSRMLQGQIGLKNRLLLMQVCGNTALNQWENWMLENSWKQ